MTLLDQTKGEFKKNQKTSLNLYLVWGVLIGIYLLFDQSWALTVTEWTANIFMTFMAVVVTVGAAVLFYADGVSNPEGYTDDDIRATQEFLRQSQWSWQMLVGILMSAAFTIFFYMEGLVYTASLFVVVYVSGQLMAYRAQQLILNINL